jgi:hypothetical protein
VAGTFNAQDVGSTLWAYATMGREPGAAVMRELEGRTGALAGALNARQVTNTLWAYATMRREPPAGLMRELEGRAEALAGTFIAQEVANTLWAYATMGQEPGAALMMKLEGRAVAVAGAFIAQEVANTLWAACVFSILRAPLEGSRWVHTVAQRLVSFDKPVLFTGAGLRQLHQFFVWSSLTGNQRVEAIDSMRSLKETCRSAFEGAPAAPSATQQQVSNTLRRMGLSVQDEVRCPKSGYSMDMLVCESALGMGGRGGAWAVEFDGPSHFLASGAPTGATLLKRRHLELLGHALVSVPYWEWNELRGVGEREQYLMIKLRACPAAGQLLMQQSNQQQQQAANIGSMASLNLNQPAAALPSTFDAHASAGAGYEGIQVPANNQEDQLDDGNTYNSPENNLQQQNASAGMPQGMYGAGFDATGAYSTCAMGFNAMMMPNRDNSAFGMDQVTSMTTEQTFQQLLLYQQQQQYMMAINAFGGFPGAYGNMAALYGYGGMPNTMNYNALYNFSSEDSHAGTGNANISMNPLHNMHHALLMQQQMAFLAQQTQAQQQHSGAGNANVSMNVYSNLGGNMGDDGSSQFETAVSRASAQQQQQQQQQQQPYGGSNGASSSMSNMWAN